jgi:hypothetical protein
LKICSGSPETSPDNLFADELEEGSVEDDEAATLEELFTSLREFEELEAIHADELDRFSDHASDALEESSPHAITKTATPPNNNLQIFIIIYLANSLNAPTLYKNNHSTTSVNHFLEFVDHLRKLRIYP